MVEKTRRSIAVAGTPRQVMDVIADYDAYPQWVAAAKSVEVLEVGPAGRARRVRFVLDAGMVKDTYVLEFDWAPDGRSVSWNLVEGEIQRAQSGSYTLAPLPDGTTEVTYQLTVDLKIPMIGLFTRKAEKAITDTALTELKKRVEG